MAPAVRVLYVDGDAAFAARAAAALEEENDRFAVETATSATAGIDRVEDGDWECVVTEYDLPETDGVAFLRRVRGSHPELPLVVFTGAGDERVASRAVSADATDYVRKGRDDRFEALAAAVRAAVASASSVRELERYREYTDAILDAIEDVFFVHDRTGDLQRWNESLTAVTGYSDGEVATMNGIEFVPEEHRERTAAAIERVFETGHARLQAPLLTKDGRTIPYEYAANRVVHPDGEPRLVGIGRDVTERVEYRRELERRNERLDEFASVVSHDLRSPLSVSRARIDLARTERDSEHLDVAADAVDRTDALLDDLLALARRGDGTVDAEPVDLADAVRRCWRTVETGAATLELDVDRTVLADEGRLRELLENLVGNAVTHGAASDRTSRAKGRTSGSDGDADDGENDTAGDGERPGDGERDGTVESEGDAATVRIGECEDASGFYVADDGPGVPPDERERAFERGYTTAADGTGFGLAIVDRIADAHDWEVRLTESTRGGARFEVVDVTFADED